MIKNKLNSVLLSLLLLVPGHISCFEQSVPQGILNKLYLSMPSAPVWMSNLTTNMTNGFSSLSDKTKYLIYGAMAALLSYVGYKVSSSSIFMSVPKSMENRDFWVPNQELNARANCTNIGLIVRKYPIKGGDVKRELAFEHYVCPVLKAHENDLDTPEKWDKFLIDIRDNAVDVTMDMQTTGFGLRMFALMNKTCPNKKTTEPLKQLLIGRHPKDTKLLQLLNQ